MLALDKRGAERLSRVMIRTKFSLLIALMLIVCHANASDMGAIAFVLYIWTISAILLAQNIIVIVLSVNKYFLTHKPWISYFFTCLLVGVGLYKMYDRSNIQTDDLVLILAALILPAISAIIIPWWQYRKLSNKKMQLTQKARN